MYPPYPTIAEATPAFLGLIKFLTPGGTAPDKVLAVKEASVVLDCILGQIFGEPNGGGDGGRFMMTEPVECPTNEEGIELCQSVVDAANAGDADESIKAINPLVWMKLLALVLKILPLITG